MEVRNGRFVYRDALFVEIDGDKRHARSSLAELKDLLLPRRITSISSSRDQVGHFYQAQLVHYGLPLTKDKPAAKLRLIEAINLGRLVVPADVRKIESDLQKEYTTMVRKAKSAMKRDDDSNAGSSNRKRKLTNDNKFSGVDSATRVYVKVGDVVVDIENSSAARNHSVKRQRTATSDNTDKAPSVNKRSSQKTEPNLKPTSRPLTTPSKAQSQCRPPAASTPPSATRQRPKQTARRGRPFHPTSSGRNPPVITVDSEPDSPPPSYSSVSNYDEEDGYNSPINEGTFVQISGEYALSITDIRINDHCSMRLHYSPDSLWGSFNIGDQQGIIRLDDTSDVADGAQKTFGWRAEHTSTGRLKFGKGCNGWIEFNGGGGARGCFNGLMFGQDVEFEAELNAAFDHRFVNMRHREMAELVQRWEDFPALAYGR